MIIIKNNILIRLKSKMLLNIKGKNILIFIKRLKTNNIELLKINILSDNEMNIIIYKSDYQKILSIKTIYEVCIKEYYGNIKYKNNILNNKYFIILILVFLIILYIISNMIFSIDIQSNDTDLKNILYKELQELGIKKYSFKKDYNELQIIKKSILDNHKDNIEWIEIDSIGTKYIIKYEPRIKTEKNSNNEYRNIVAKKDCVIKSMNINNGQILKNINSYVKKGDIIVSGYITLDNNIKNTISSSGSVYGEVWYNVDIKYPFDYKEEITTGNKKNVYVIKIFNKYIELFNFNKYKNKKVINENILSNNLLPISFMHQTQYEVNKIDDNYDYDTIYNKAIKLANDKLQGNLNSDEYIENYKVIKEDIIDNYLYLKIFFTTIENVSEYSNIEIINDIDNKIE